MYVLYWGVWGIFAYFVGSVLLLALLAWFTGVLGIAFSEQTHASMLVKGLAVLLVIGTFVVPAAAVYKVKPWKPESPDDK
jgi:hypothetical protein